MGRNFREFMTCDYDDEEISGVWIEVSSGGDSTATFGSFAEARIPASLAEETKTFCGVPHMAQWFKERAPGAATREG
jgi:hypothetical protein